MKILNDPFVRMLIEKLDLIEPSQIHLKISNWDVLNGKIVINEVEVLDGEGNFIKFADINSLGEHIHKYYTTFDSRAKSTNKTNSSA